jgi:hypothetical protein
MKVAELKKLLDGFDDDMEVCFEHHTGNYWRHVLAIPIRRAQYESVKYSTYNEELKVIGEETDTNEDDEIKEIVLLK